MCTVQFCTVIDFVISTDITKIIAFIFKQPVTLTDTSMCTTVHASL